MKTLLFSLVTSVILSVSVMADSGTCTPCDESDWSVERGFAAVGDLLVVRPLGAAATIGGFGIFAVVSPFAAMADSTEEVFNTLVEKPSEYTFQRDLGVWSK